MTSRQPPVLDIVITRIIMGPSPGRDGFNQPLPGEETTTSFWARREDFVGRDLVEGTETGLVTIMDSRYIVRAESGPWAVGDQFTDEEGRSRTVRGVAAVGGRGRHLELLARRVE